MGFHAVASTCEDLSIHVSFTTVELILTKLLWFLFFGYGQTDTISKSSHGNMSAHKNFSSKLKIRSYLSIKIWSPDDGDAYIDIFRDMVLD